MSRILVLLGFILASVPGSGQAVDGVIVEVYHVEQRTEGPPLVTYRIFIDLAEGHELQMVYGDARNPLEFRTTTTFFNDTVNGSVFGDRIDAGRLDRYPLALDSWLTIGAASDDHWGLPRALDTDASVLHCPPYTGRSNALAKERSHIEPLCANDGLVAEDSVKDVVEFRMPMGYLKDIRGSVIHTMDGAWAVLGGTPGITTQNLALIAQLTTTGELSYQLNVQVRTPDKRVVRCVSTAASPADEERIETLRGTARWMP